MPRDNFRDLDEEDMRVIFDLFDTDGGGTIGREDVPEMIRTLLFETPTQDEVDRLIDKFDDSGDGELDFKEFCAMMRQYVSPLDITVPMTPDHELGLVLRKRKDDKICILHVEPELCPALYSAARTGILRPGHPISKIDGEVFHDPLVVGEYLRRRNKEHAAVITLGAPETHSALGHHLVQPWWQMRALAGTGFGETLALRKARQKVRQSASNTTADSYHAGHEHCAYV